MDNSIFIARVLGIVYVVVGFAFVGNKKLYKHLVKDLLKHDGTLFLWGMFTLVIGAMVSVAHPYMEIQWNLLITLIGWLATIKGASIMLFPNEMHKLVKTFDSETWRLWAVLSAFVLGLYMLYFGFIA